MYHIPVHLLVVKFDHYRCCLNTQFQWSTVSLVNITPFLGETGCVSRERTGMTIDPVIPLIQRNRPRLSHLSPRPSRKAHPCPWSRRLHMGFYSRKNGNFQWSIWGKGGLWHWKWGLMIFIYIYGNLYCAIDEGLPVRLPFSFRVMWDLHFGIPKNWSPALRPCPVNWSVWHLYHHPKVTLDESHCQLPPKVATENLQSVFPCNEWFIMI